VTQVLFNAVITVLFPQTVRISVPRQIVRSGFLRYSSIRPFIWKG
jgi:hypothetical protein